MASSKGIAVHHSQPPIAIADHAAREFEFEQRRREGVGGQTRFGWSDRAEERGARTHTPFDGIEV